MPRIDLDFSKEFLPDAILLCDIDHELPLSLPGVGIIDSPVPFSSSTDEITAAIIRKSLSLLISLTTVYSHVSYWDEVPPSPELHPML